MIEVQKGEVGLPEDTSEQFDVILEFIYTVPAGLSFFKDRASNKNYSKDLIRLYFTADKYGIDKLQDCIIDWLCEW